MHRVRLRHLVGSDVDELTNWAADDVFRSHAGWSDQPSVEVRRSWAASIADPPAELIRLAAKIGSDLVGYVDLHGEDRGRRELGFVVGPSCRWGQGMGTAAASAGLQYAFTALGLESVWAEAVEANLASVRILRSIGMKQTGAGEEESFLGRRSRYLRFSITRPDWDGGREPASVAHPANPIIALSSLSDP